MPEIIVKYFPKNLKQGYGFFDLVNNSDIETYKIKRGLFFHINNVKDKLTNDLLKKELKLKVEIVKNEKGYTTQKVIEIIEVIEIETIEEIDKLRFFVPNDILEALKKSKIINNGNFNDFKINPALVLTKFSNGHVSKDEKKQRFEEFIKVFNESDNNIYQILAKKQEKIKSAYQAEEFKCQTSWRLIVGMGTESVYENSMTLHHTYGIPYIPASAIKGTVRNYTISEYFQSSSPKIKNEELALKDPLFRAIFGDEENRGNIIFFDTYPSKKPMIELDIMNNHNQKYYQGDQLPSDSVNPVPLFFISITEANFNFLLARAKNEEINFINEKSTLAKNFPNTSIFDIAYELMKKALTESGVGAKTSSGYGYFTEW